MPHFQSPTLLTSPRILFDCAIWHLQHQHDCYHCRKQRQPLCRVLGRHIVGLLMLSVPQDVGSLFASLSWEVTLSTCVYVGPYLSALLLKYQSP